MNDYKQEVIDAYAGGGEVNRANEAGQYGMEFHYTKKIMSEYIKEDTKVVEVGCGGGYYGLYFAKSCRNYLGIDLSPVNISIFNEKIGEYGYNHVRAEVGDATYLSNIADDSFDVVMCLGPLYHLKREDRRKCITECKRICKNGGIISFAFINKLGAITKFGPTYGWKNVMTVKIRENVLDKGIDDVRPDVFYYTMPEEVEEDAKEAGLEIVKVAGLDFLLFEDKIEEFTEEERVTWFRFADMLNESPSCAGLCNHALLVCRK